MRPFLAILIFCFFLVSPQVVDAQTQRWYYPMTDYDDRLTVKNFATLINQAFYQGKESLFPGLRLYGYHAGVDLDTFSDEQNSLIPVYAITHGTIRYLSSGVQGYGGVIIQSLDGTTDTALYGHVKTTDIGLKVGDKVTAGQKLTNLGDRFSPETGGERKHLHFAIHKGNTTYLRGHEDTMSRLFDQWENPTTFLQNRNAQAVATLQTTIASPTSSPPLDPTSLPVQEQPLMLWQKMIRWFQSVFQLS